MISIIVPAHNEAYELPRALASIFSSARAVGEPFEVVVVNDASTDATPQIARHAGARVIDVNLRQISAVRNAGAKAATGEFLFFVDADTQISVEVLRAALSALRKGAVGGGAWVDFAEPMSLFIRCGLFVFSLLYMRGLRWAAGCFVFARREAFESIGGFDLTLYASEEIVLSIALKKKGRFVVLREPVRTSGRKMRLYSFWNIVPLTYRLLRHGPAFLRQRRGLEWWYEGKREHTPRGRS